MIPDAQRCDSLIKAILRDEGSHEVYIRCQKTRDHESPNHKGWLKSWRDEDEDGYIDNDEDVA